MNLLTLGQFISKFETELDIGYWESGCIDEAGMDFERWQEHCYAQYLAGKHFVSDSFLWRIS